jgi:hypothetical protein
MTFRKTIQLGAASKRVSKFLRRIRKVSARHLTDRLPSVSKQLQRLRYRGWSGSARAQTESSPAYPDFIILGAPKCGTSWLQGLLRQHPSVLMVPDEIEYFSMHPDYPNEWYAEHFARCLASANGTPREEILLGERSARYCAIGSNEIRRCRELLPKAQLILMARDPVARHWAHAKKYFAKRRLRDPDHAVLSISRKKLFDFFLEARPLGEFSRIIANWTSIYPSRQLLIVSQEATLASPRATLDAVLQHIGLSADYDPALFTLLSQQRNPGPRVDMPADVAEFLTEMFAAERIWLKDFFGDRSFAYAS